MTGYFDICGVRFFLAFQGRPDTNQETLFHSYVSEVWQRIPMQQRQVILAKHTIPKVLLYTRLRDYRSLSLGGTKGRVPVPIAEVGYPVELSGPCGADDYMFSCDRSRLFALPKSWTLMVIGEELAHSFLIAAEDPSHLNPPAIDDRKFVAYDIARESKMQGVLCGEWGFDRAEYGRMMAWMKQTESGLCPVPFEKE